jgi:hypothetical protein
MIEAQAASKAVNGQRAAGGFKVKSEGVRIVICIREASV